MIQELEEIELNPIPELLYRLLLPKVGRDVYEDHVASTADFGANQPLFLALVPKGGVILDIGANIGTHAIPWAVSGRRVVAYEALECNAERLRSAAEVNRLSSVQLEVRHKAAWNCRTRLKMSGISAWGAVSEDGSEEVDGVAIDDESFAFAHIDAVKLDIEGAELFALQGMRRRIERDHPHIIFESNSVAMQGSRVSLTDIRRFLTDLGYALYRIHGNKLAPAFQSQEVTVCDYLATALPIWDVGPNTGFRVAPLTTAELVASILLQDRFTDDHKKHVLAVSSLLPESVVRNQEVAVLLARWRSVFDNEAIRGFLTAIVGSDALQAPAKL